MFIDFLDISLWDSFKDPAEEEHKNKSLLEHFTEIDRKKVLLTVAGNIRTGEDVNKIISSNVDFVTIGRAAILHHDFPNRVLMYNNFIPISTPSSKEHLRQEGLSDKFIEYLRVFKGFVEE